MAELDDGFYDRADAHIHLSNAQISQDIGAGMVSASMMYANARFGAWLAATWCGSQSEMQARHNENVEYFIEQFRKMLVENYVDYADNFDTYMKRD